MGEGEREQELGEEGGNGARESGQRKQDEGVMGVREQEIVGKGEQVIPGSHMVSGTCCPA